MEQKLQELKDEAAASLRERSISCVARSPIIHSWEQHRSYKSLKGMVALSSASAAAEGPLSYILGNSRPTLQLVASEEAARAEAFRRHSCRHHPYCAAEGCG
eukprot:TRINITY_DN2129_c0_g1_i6.p4 TRINITY_DN2129_c0_g1~~TRINITY_DN2129_c0_g1_i6.p4  ORF type:complete len:102 (+),score=12.07 TRINITY_DN2129_c0_g1_i6:550-855(+)